MGYGIWDEEQGRTLTDEEVDEEGLYLNRTGMIVKFDVVFRSHDNYTRHTVHAEPVDVSEQYKPLMKVGCG